MKVKNLFRVMAFVPLFLLAARTSPAAQFFQGNELDTLVKMLGQNGTVIMGKVTKIECPQYPGCYALLSGTVLKAFTDSITHTSYTVDQTVTDYKFQFNSFKIPGLVLPQVTTTNQFMYLYGRHPKSGNSSFVAVPLRIVTGSDGKEYVAVDGSKPETLFKDVSALKANAKALSSGGNGTALDQALSRVLSPGQKIKVKAFTATTMQTTEGLTVDSNLNAGDLATIFKAMGVMFYGKQNQAQ